MNATLYGLDKKKRRRPFSLASFVTSGESNSVATADAIIAYLLFQRSGLLTQTLERLGTEGIASAWVSDDHGGICP
jgi:hypothetical protein